MALSSVVKHWRDGTVVLKDGTGTPLTNTVRFNMGDCKIGPLKAKLRATAVYQARGTVTSIRHGDREFPTLSLSCQMAEFSETGTGTIADFIGKKAATPYAARVSTLGSSAEVFTCDVAVTVEGTDLGDSADHTFTAEDWEPTFEWAEGQPNMFTLTGPVYGAITGDIAIATT